MSLFKKKSVDFTGLPKHIAFIMDGNGRWAKKRGLPRKFGHKEGVQALIRVVDYCNQIGIEILSFYMFSTENWKRPKEEIDYIFSLVDDFGSDLQDKYYDMNIKFQTMGDLTKLPIDLQKTISVLLDRTANNDGMIVNLCLNYGGRNEIVNACNMIIKDGINLVDENIFRKYLYNGDIVDPDLIVRSSGEKRISNFLLYQMAYSEFVFCDDYWPDFNSKIIDKILVEYQSRSRRFGAI